MKSAWRQVGGPGELDNKRFRIDGAFASATIPHTLVGDDLIFNGQCPLEAVSTASPAPAACAGGCVGPTAACIAGVCTCGRGYSKVNGNQVRRASPIRRLSKSSLLSAHIHLCSA